MKKGNGKKRIARLRNVDKKQRLRVIFGGPVPKPKPRNKELVEVDVPVVGVQPDNFHSTSVLTWDLPALQYRKAPAGIFNSGHSFIAALKKRGYEQLGSGAFSTVLGKPGKDRVIKVTRSSQDNWIDYIQWAAQKGYCGNFAPRVYSWKKYTKGSTFSVSVVERMKEEVRHSKTDYTLIEHLLYPARCGNTMAQVYLEDLVPGSVKFFEELIKTFDANDIYGKNMMIRPDGSLCVTDPVFGRQKINTNRLRSRDFTSMAPAIRIYCEELFREVGISIRPYF